MTTASFDIELDELPPAEPNDDDDLDVTPVDPEAPYGYLKDGKTPRKSAAGRKPKTAAAGRPATPRPPSSPPKVSAKKKLSVSEKIMGAAKIGLPVLAEASPVDAAIVASFIGTVAGAWEDAARENEAVARFFDGFGKGAALPTAIITTGLMVGMVAVNHGALDRTPFGQVIRERFIGGIVPPVPPAG